METVKSYKCPCCGAPLLFSAGTQNLHCDSCGNDFSIDALEQIDTADSAASAEKSKYNWELYEPRDYSAEDSVNIAMYICPSCGAQIAGDENLGATVCPYCGNANIIKGQFEGGLRPDFIIPFKLDKKAAMQAFEQYSAKAPFLPDEFKDKKKISEMAGVYVPFWAFDCDCNADITYRAERMTVWSDSNYNYTKTDHFKLLRQGKVSFMHIPVDGSGKIDNTYMEAIEPFNYNDAVDFDAAYLSGYLADKYDVGADDTIERANERVKNSTEDAFRSTVSGYGTVRTENTRVSFSNGKIRYALMPVWMLNIKYGDKMYKYAINGQTGKTAGVYPICKRKKNIFFAKNFGISFAVAAAIAAAVIYFFL